MCHQERASGLCGMATLSNDVMRERESVENKIARKQIYLQLYLTDVSTLLIAPFTVSLATTQWDAKIWSHAAKLMTSL